MLRFTYVLCIALTKRNDSVCTCCRCTPICPSTPTYPRTHTHTNLHFHVIHTHTQQRHFSLLKGRDTACVLVFLWFPTQTLVFVLFFFVFVFFCHGGEKDGSTHRSLAMTVFPSKNNRQISIDNAHRWGSHRERSGWLGQEVRVSAGGERRPGMMDVCGDAWSERDAEKPNAVSAEVNLMVPCCLVDSGI